MNSLVFHTTSHCSLVFSFLFLSQTSLYLRFIHITFSMIKLLPFLVEMELLFLYLFIFPVHEGFKHPLLLQILFLIYLQFLLPLLHILLPVLNFLHSLFYFNHFLLTFCVFALFPDTNFKFLILKIIFPDCSSAVFLLPCL